MKKRAKNDAALKKRYEASVVTNKKPLRPPKEAAPRKVKDMKNPRDVSIDAEGARALDAVLNQNGKRSAAAQEALVTRLLPARADQSRDNLSIRANRTPQTPRPENRVEENSNDLYRELIDVNAHLYRQRAEGTFALEDLVRLRLLSPQALTPSDKQARQASQLARDADFMRAQLEQLARAPPLAEAAAQPQNTSVLTKEAVRAARLGKPVLVKVGLVFGALNYAFGYERRASSDHRDFVQTEYARDKAARRARFFAGDALDDAVPYRSAPARFKMFRDLQAANLARYRHRMALHGETLERLPRADLELVNRAYITRFRRRPRADQQLCFRGVRCRFYTFPTDAALRYVGRAFFTERQLAGGEAACAAANPQALCIDCLLERLTLQCLDNIANERPQTQPLNHFSCIVGEGEYGQAAMLPVKFNKLETGIVGCVPWYHENNRHMKMTVSAAAADDMEGAEGAVELAEGLWAESDRARKKRKVTVDAESYLAEIGLDF